MSNAVNSYIERDDGSLLQLDKEQTHEERVIARLDRIIELLEHQSPVVITITKDIDPTALTSQIRDELVRARMLGGRL